MSVQVINICNLCTSHNNLFQGLSLRHMFRGTASLSILAGTVQASMLTWIQTFRCLRQTDRLAELPALSEPAF